MHMCNRTFLWWIIYNTNTYTETDTNKMSTEPMEIYIGLSLGPL